MSLIIKKIIMYLVLIALVVYEIWAWFRDVRNWKKKGKHSRFEKPGHCVGSFHQCISCRQSGGTDCGSL